MNKPARIDGVALIASTTTRTGRARRPPTSLRNTAVSNPSTHTNAEIDTTVRLVVEAMRTLEDTADGRVEGEGLGAGAPPSRVGG